MQTLSLEICQSPEEAIERGFVYREPEFTKVEATKAIVVKNGTVNGNSTVDIIVEDESGKKYVFMITAALLKSIPY